MSELAPPEGFVEVDRRSPFLDLVGPLWVRDVVGEAGAEYGFRVEARHANARGAAHGGLLMTLADLVLGYGTAFGQDPPVGLTTASTSVDFAGAARVGDWVTGRAEVHRIGRTLGFANVYLAVEGRRIVRASSVFAVPPHRAHPGFRQRLPRGRRTAHRAGELGVCGGARMSPTGETGVGWDFLVERDDLRSTTVRAARPVEDLAPGEVLIGVDAFALSANNLTYAVTGDRFGYWRVFPPVTAAEEGWGRIPAWGTGSVVDSACLEVEVGERFTGMVPMSSHFLAMPRPTRDGFADLAAHRAEVDPVYNRYTRVTGRPVADLERAAALRPVYILSFVLAHHLRAADWLGAERLLVTSASSKASLGLAHALASDEVSMVGLTSPRHRELVLAAGLWDEVETYDSIGDLPASVSTALIDVSGNGGVRDAVRAHLGSALVDTLHVGQTDWDQPDEALLGSADGASPFFAPTAIQQLVGAWGPADFAQRLDAGLLDFIEQTKGWLEPDHRDGRDAVVGAFRDVAAGNVPPDRFVIVRP